MAELFNKSSMIYIEDKNIVIITPPHTASLNVHKGLGDNAYWVIGEDPFDENSINLTIFSVKMRSKYQNISRACGAHVT